MVREIPVEDYLEDGRYVIRVVLPGVDPEKDLDVTITGDVLTIRVVRPGTSHGAVRSVQLPTGANLKHLTVTFGDDVLEIIAEMPQWATRTRRLPVLPR